MSVTLNPPTQLGFPRPLTAIVKRSLFIQNPHSSPVAFKVKTTAPKQYCVRPNQGRVEPNETIEVHIVLQPLPADPPPHAKCKDKFLVQSTFIPPDEEIRTLPEMWSAVERTNKAAIHEQKIRCAYLAAEDGSGDPNGIPEENEESGILDHSKLDESRTPSRASSVRAPSIRQRSTSGLTQWTLESERDLTLFRNNGYTVWEVTPTTAPKVPHKHATPPVSPLAPGFGARAHAPTPPPQRHEIIVKVEAAPLAASASAPPCNNCSVGIFSAAEASPAPAPKTNGAHKEFAATSSPLAAAPIIGGAAATFSQTADETARSPPSPTPASREVPVAPGGVPVAKELPSLSAADVAALAPTNVALEKSILASTSDSDQLSVALKEIERLKAQLADAQGPTVTGLRKRGGAGADSASAGAKTATVTAPAAASGVPVEVCAGLVFAVFVLTYLFF